MLRARRYARTMRHAAEDAMPGARTMIKRRVYEDSDEGAKTRRARCWRV